MSTLDTLVELIGEIEYGDKIPTAALELAKRIGAAIIYGYSDDSIMVEGVTEDQAGAYDEKNIWVDKEGFLPINENQDCTDANIETISDCRKLVKRFDQSVRLQIIEDEDDWLWQYKTDWPHRVFEMKEDGEPYCKGIVFLFPKN